MEQHQLFNLGGADESVLDAVSVRPNIWLMTPDEIPPLLLSIERTASCLGVDVPAVERLIRRGQLSGVRVEGVLQIPGRRALLVMSPVSARRKDRDLAGARGRDHASDRGGSKRGCGRWLPVLLLSVEEAARKIGVQRTTMYRLVRRGRNGSRCVWVDFAEGSRKRGCEEYVEQSARRSSQGVREHDRSGAEDPNRAIQHLQGWRTGGGMVASPSASPRTTAEPRQKAHSPSKSRADRNSQGARTRKATAGLGQRPQGREKGWPSGHGWSIGWKRSPGRRTAGVELQTPTGPQWSNI